MADSVAIVPFAANADASADAAQAHVAAAAAAAEQADKASSPVAAAAALEEASREAAAAAAAAATAKTQAAQEISKAPAAVRSEFKTQSVVSTLPVSAFNLIKLPPNGWNLYNAVLVANQIEQGRRPDLDKELSTFNTQAHTLSKELVQGLEESDKNFFFTMMTNYRVPDNATNDMLKEKLKEIDADPSLDADLKDLIKQSLRFQYQKNSAVYQVDREGKPIDTPDTYIRNLSMPIDANEMDKGPKASPDISYFAPKIAKALKLSIYIYRPSSSQPEVYKLVSANKVDDAPEVKILHVNRNYISILSEKVKTDAKARGLGKIGKAMISAKEKSLNQIADDIDLPANVKLKDHIVIGDEKVVLDDDLEDLVDAEAGTNFLGMVLFNEKYFPGEDEKTLEVARFVFNSFFSEKAREDPVPPCGKDEYEILIRGLTTRRETLYTEIELKRGRDDDTIELRALIKKSQTLEGLIKNLQLQAINGACQDYEADGAQGVFSKISSQQEEEITSLLRQFAFMVLQAKNPVAEYSERTEEAKGIVEDLRNDPVTADMMDTYLEKWNEQAKKAGSSMPRILIEVLDRTDTQTGVIDKMAQDQIDELLKDIIGMGRQSFTGGVQQGGGSTQLQDFENLVTQIEQEQGVPKAKALRIIRWIIDNTRAQWENLSQLKNKEGELASDLESKSKEIATLSAKLAEAGKAALAIEEKLKAKTIEAADLQGVAAGRDANAKEAETKILAERDRLTLQIAELQTGLEAKTKGFDTITGELEALRTKCSAGELTAADSAATVEKLTQKLAGLEQQLALMTTENAQLKESQAQLQEQITTQTATISKLQTEEAAATAAAAAATSKIAGLESQVAELTTSSKGNAESEAAAKAEITQLAAQIQGLESEIKTLQSGKTDDAKAAAESAAKITNLTKESESLQGQVKTLEAAAAAAATAAAADAAKIAETQGLLDAAKTEVAATTKDKDAISAQLTAAVSQQEVLQKKIDDLYAQWAEKNQELTNVKAAAIDDKNQAAILAEQLQGKLTVAEYKVNEQLQVIAAREDSLSQMAVTMKGLEDKIVDSAGEIATLQKRVAEDTANYTKLDAAAKAAAQEANVRLDALTAENAATKAELEKQKLEYDAQIAALKEMIAAQTAEITGLKDTLATTTANLATTQAEKGKLNTQLSALQRTYNDDIKKLGDSLRAKQLEIQAKVTELTAKLDKEKEQLVLAQNKLSELTAKFDAQKVIADQVPQLQTDLETQKGLAEQLPALQKQLDEQQIKLDNMPTDSVVAAAAVAQAENDLASMPPAQIKVKYPTLFRGSIQKKGDSLGGWNTRDAAMVAAATRVWYIQFESKDYKNRMVISIQGVPSPTKNAGEFTMATKVKGQPTTYTFKEVAGGPAREQWINKYIELDRIANATTKQGVQADMNKVLSELQNFAKSIVDQKDYAVPTGLTPQAGEAFMQIFNSIKKLKTDSAPSSSNQACFLSYFIVFFFKALFFTKADTARRQAILKRIDTLTDNVLQSLKGADLFPAGTADKNIIYKVMEVIFTLIDASETLFINKETRSGNPAQGTDIGLSVIKTKEDAIAKKILEILYDKVSGAINADKTFTDDMNFVEAALVADMLISQPKIYFNKPLPIKAPSDATQDATDLLTYPNMTFMPNGIADVQKSDIKTRFQIIDVAGGFKRRQLMVKGIGGAQAEWQNALSFTMQDTTLQYSTLFAAFVVFGRKYLVAAKDDFVKYSCKVPAMIENPSSMLTSMSAETPGTATCIDTETIVEKKDVEGQPLTKRFRASFKTPIQDATNLDYEWEYTTADGNPIKQVARLLFTPEEEKTLKEEEWYRGEAQEMGMTEEVARHSAMIADLWKRAEERALQGKSNPGFSLTKSGQLASITFPAPGTYTVSCTIKYKRQGVDCVSKPGTQKIAQQGGGLDVVVEAPKIAAATPSCDVVVNINDPIVFELAATFKTKLTGTLDGISGQKYRWAYTSSTDKKNSVPMPGSSATMNYEFPKVGTYKVTCDLEYSKKGISSPCKAAQASVKLVLSSETSTPGTTKVDAPEVAEHMSTKGSVNNAISAATKTAKAIAAKKLALTASPGLSIMNQQREAAQKAQPTVNPIAAKPASASTGLSALNKQREAAQKGTTIEQNALSMSGNNFKQSLRARGFAI
jgi:hypothetical protein